MKAPFILIALDSLDVFIRPSLIEAEAEIEPPDVDVWEVFDSDGQGINVLTIEENTTSFLIPVTHQRVKLKPTAEDKSERLRSLLHQHLERAGKSAPVTHLSLESLIHLCSRS